MVAAAVMQPKAALRTAAIQPVLMSWKPLARQQRESTQQTASGQRTLPAACRILPCGLLTVVLAVLLSLCVI